jgi:hypothetical protein
MTADLLDKTEVWLVPRNGRILIRAATCTEKSV